MTFGIPPFLLQQNSASVISARERASIVERRELPVLRHAAVHTPSAPHSRHFALHHSTLGPDFTPFHTQTLTPLAEHGVMCVSSSDLSQTFLHVEARVQFLLWFIQTLL